MDKEDITRMARETGVEWLMHNQFYKDHLQHFAALVNNDFKERLAQAIEQMPFGKDTTQSFAIFVREFK